MSDKYDDILKYIRRAFGIVLAGIAFLLVLGMCSCTRTVYVPQTTIQRDSIYLTKYHRDSIYLHDSVYVWQKADTLLVEKWHTKYIERVKTDTMYIQHSDTIREAYPVEKQLSFSQKSFITLGKVSLGVLIGTILAILIYYIIKRKSI